MRHIGEHIRDEIIPKDMSVKAAAELLNVGRPTLSNLLHGKSSLSKAMAQKLEIAFGANAAELLKKQTEQEPDFASHSADSTKAYVQPFLDLTAAHIDEWIQTQPIKARSRLSVFLRSLVNSTNTTLSECDFPGNDHSQIHGWDGYVTTATGNPWVPSGKSGWEFGTNKEIKKKADKDYKKSLKLPRKERQDTTFIFVTPRKWNGKKTWAKERNAENQWKDVRAYDQSNLEQWLEQSIPSQTWLANELKIQSHGTYSLDQHWTTWSADCDPPLKLSLFSEAIEDISSNNIKSKLSGIEQIIIKSDSRDEGVAFLCALFAHDDHALAKYRDRAVYFTEAGVMAKLLVKNTSIIPIVATPALEKELAIFKADVSSITIQPTNISGFDADHTVETLSASGFSTALKNMGVDDDEVDRFARESGRSLTVLRRILSKTEAIRTPQWAHDSKLAASLVAITLAGAWNTQEEADKDVVSILAFDRNYEDIEQDLLVLLQLEDAPVWMIDSYRGVVSKFDALFSIRNSISEESIVRFLDFAEVVLSADDPTLDLPEEQRWLSAIHGKKREFSAMLRRSISETLVLLSMHEHSLFHNRLGLCIGDRISQLIRNVLSGLSTRLLEAQASDLPVYAEAAPDEFLNIIEQDLSTDSPVVFEIINYKTSSMFSSPPYVGLLWALENIAWSAERLERCCLILAQLHQNATSENTSHSPANTLASIFRSWHPQTSATLIQRQTILENLATKFPDTAWLICLQQLDGGTTMSIPTHKPLWRTDARGANKRVSIKERCDFEMFALNLAISKTHHSTAEVCTLIACVPNLTVSLHAGVWATVDTWHRSASDSDVADVRETIRTTFLTYLAQETLTHTFKKKDCKQIRKKATDMYELVKPTDSAYRCRWLFANDTLVLNYDDAADDIANWRENADKAALHRQNALTSIVETEDLQGIIKLAEVVNRPEIVGQHTAAILRGHNDIAVVSKLAYETYIETEKDSMKSLLAGLLWEARNKKCIGDLFSVLAEDVSANDLLVLYLQAPHSTETWNLVAKLSQQMQDKYWRQVEIRFPPNHSGVPLAFSKLLQVERPLAALHTLDHSMSAISPRLLYQALDKATFSTEEGHESFFSYFDIEKALDTLGASGDFSVPDLAVLEYRYLAALDMLHPPIPHIEKLINDSPEYYVQQIVFSSARTDNRRDPKQFELPNDDSKMKHARQSHLLLDGLRKIPGRNSDGKTESKLLISWIQNVQKSLSKLGRSNRGNYKIGQLLSRCESDEDGCWPSEAVRDALEVTMTEKMASGFLIGKMNLRGVHFRDKGGRQERELAANFEKWATHISSTHPKVANALRQIRDRYLKDGEREDRNEDVYRRLV